MLCLGEIISGCCGSRGSTNVTSRYVIRTLTVLFSRLQVWLWIRKLNGCVRTRSVFSPLVFTFYVNSRNTGSILIVVCVQLGLFWNLQQRENWFKVNPLLVLLNSVFGIRIRRHVRSQWVVYIVACSQVWAWHHSYIGKPLSLAFSFHYCFALQSSLGTPCATWSNFKSFHILSTECVYCFISPWINSCYWSVQQ